MKVRRVDFYPDDWLSGTLELSDLDRGVYITICALIYARGSPITIELLKRHCHSHGNTLAASLTRLSEAGKIVRNGLEIGQKRCRNELERAEKRVRNASENGTKGNYIKKMVAATRGSAANANKQQTTNNIHTEEAKASPAAVAAPQAIDPVKEIFDRGVAILGSNRRALLGKMCKQYGQAAVLAAIVATESAAPVEPVSYFVKACEQRQTNGRSQKHGPLTTLWEGAYHAALKWEEAHGDSEDRSLAYEPLLGI